MGGWVLLTECRAGQDSGRAAGAASEACWIPLVPFLSQRERPVSPPTPQCTRAQIMRYVNGVASRAHVAVCQALRGGMYEYEVRGGAVCWGAQDTSGHRRLRVRRGQCVGGLRCGMYEHEVHGGA